MQRLLVACWTYAAALKAVILDIRCCLEGCDISRKCLPKVFCWCAAVSLGELGTALQLAEQSGSELKWRQLGELALSSGKLQVPWPWTACLQCPHLSQLLNCCLLPHWGAQQVICHRRTDHDLCIPFSCWAAGKHFAPQCHSGLCLQHPFTVCWGTSAHSSCDEPLTLTRSSCTPAQQVAEECLSKAADLSGLLLLHTAKGSAAGLQDLVSRATSAKRQNIAFLCQLLLGNLGNCVDLLLAAGRVPEAAFFARTYLPSRISEASPWRFPRCFANRTARPVMLCADISVCDLPLEPSIRLIFCSVSNGDRFAACVQQKIWPLHSSRLITHVDRDRPGSLHDLGDQLTRQRALRRW